MENIKIGKLRVQGRGRYYIQCRHTVLGLHKEVSAPEVDILHNKVDALIASWEKRYEIHLKRSTLAKGKELAENMMLEAEEKRSRLRGILNHTLSIDDAVNWEVLKSHNEFKFQQFGLKAPALPEIGFFQQLFGRGREIEDEYDAKLKEYEKKKADWYAVQESEKQVFLKKQEKTNAKVETLKNNWRSGASEAIVEHASIVLEASDYDSLISKEFEIQYDDKTKTLLVDYLLPSPDDMPVTKTVRFVPGAGEMKETQIAEREKKLLYDDVCYQMCLRSIHELFEADSPSYIQQIVFNGTANYIDKGTGHEGHATILSLMAKRDEFVAINLARIEPKICFRNLKGVSAANLVGLSPIAPIMELDKSDKRFVEARQAGIDSDGSTNLAAMDWEDFEHLVREVFDKEFSSRGGEVKITQSSSDGGVDAIAFDPDPISGGKIIIQAKRYTKTVGVAAVRDLYGTILNEGANKGILVTTSDYGPDAYKFVANKPLTLMTGNHLLHLLEKHGTKAKINLREARKERGLSG